VKAYLQANYGPGAQYDFTKIVHVGWGSGASREVYDIPQDDFAFFGQPYRPPLVPSTSPICASCGYWRSFPPSGFYAAWKYAGVFGGAKAIFDSMRSKLEAPLSDAAFSSRPYWLNQYLAGYLGYLELQKMAGYPEDPAVKAVYNHLLQIRVDNFSQDHPVWGSWYDNPMNIAFNFMFLTPELADYMASNALAKVQTAMEEYLFDTPYWFVSKYDMTYEEGTLGHLYNVPALFQAKAWILDSSYDDLVKYLDVPAFTRGDLFYIQNLAATLDAAVPGPLPTFADVPFTHAYHDEIEALYQAGYTAGCGANPLRYCPEQTMNRAESAVFVERGIHRATYDPPVPATQVFADLVLDSWAAKWVNGLWVDQYTSGCGTNPLVYCPWQGHTRAEGCVFYLRMLNGPTYEPPQPTQQTFADVPLNTWYAKWVQAGYDAGLLTACQTTPELRFCPDSPLTRALAAYMMVQAKGLR
jgi:hypothetical protein